MAPPRREAGTWLLLAVLFGLTASATTAGTIHVTPGAVDSLTNGNCSLVEAILAANLDVGAIDACARGDGADVIVLPRGSHYFFTEGWAPEGSTAATPAITSDITIEANGARIERLDNGNTPPFRLFQVDPGGKLTLRNARVGYGWSNGPGGLIQVLGDLIVEHSLLHHGTAGSPWDTTGGAIAFLGAADKAVEIHASVLRDNLAAHDGGAISARSSGSIRISDSWLRDNHPVAESDQTRGGAIFVEDSAGLTITGSTFTGNGHPADYTPPTQSGPGWGGAIYDDGTPLVIRNSTFVENRAFAGPFLYLVFGASAQLVNVTVSENSVQSVGEPVPRQWTMVVDRASAELTGTIISGNRNDNPDSLMGSIRGSGDFDVISHGGNLIGVTDPASLAEVFSEPGDQVGLTEPRLEWIAWNGGFTPTMRPQPDSPAVDAMVGDCTGATPTDQRGLPRPVDGDASGTAACDAGAVELSFDVLFVDPFDGPPVP